MTMDIKYFWPARNGDINEITDITIKSKAMPRIGELVDISIQVTKNERVEKMGRVKDITWYVRDKYTNACVFLDA